MVEKRKMASWALKNRKFATPSDPHETAERYVQQGLIEPVIIDNEDAYKIVGTDDWYMTLDSDDGRQWTLIKSDPPGDGLYETSFELDDHTIAKWIKIANPEPESTAQTPVGITKEQILDELYGLHPRGGSSKDPERSQQLMKLLTDMGEPVPGFLKGRPTAFAWVRKNCKFAGMPDPHPAYLDHGYTHESTVRSAISLAQMQLNDVKTSLDDPDGPMYATLLLRDIAKVLQQGADAARLWRDEVRSKRKGPDEAPPN